MTGCLGMHDSIVETAWQSCMGYDSHEQLYSRWTGAGRVFKNDHEKQCYQMTEQSYGMARVPMVLVLPGGGPHY